MQGQRVQGHRCQREIGAGEGEKRRALEVVAECVEFPSKPAAYARETVRAFIDPPAMVPG